MNIRYSQAKYNMDWFDQYLDALADGSTVSYPPDTHVWRPVKPTKQQQSLIQDSIIADVVRMRMIQEARLQEISQGLGGGYDSGTGVKEGPAAPEPTPTPALSGELTYLSEEINYLGEVLTYTVA